MRYFVSSHQGVLGGKPGKEDGHSIGSGQASVLLICTNHLNWVGVRTTLIDYADVDLVGDVQEAYLARQITRATSPRLIIAPDKIAGQTVIPLMQELHILSPTSKIMVIGDHRTLERLTLQHLRELPSVAYVLWEDITTDILLLYL